VKVQLLVEAKEDLLGGYRFCERQAAGLGDYFLDSLFFDIDSLSSFAGVHAQHFGYHRLLVRRFPFAVYYRVERGIVRVYAVLDCRRDPSWIRDRLI
jgi:hypothetical protein